MKLVLSVCLLGLLALASAKPYVEVEAEWEEAYVASDVDPEEILMQQEGPAVSEGEMSIADLSPLSKLCHIVHHL